jgi:hypothetical protein
MSPVGTPNYLTVAPDGSVGAAFSGHVSAQGLDFLHTDSSQNIAQQIRWLPDPPGGNQPGPREIGSWLDMGSNRDASALTLDALSPYSTDPVKNPGGNPGLARIELVGENPVVGDQSTIDVQAWGPTGEKVYTLLSSDDTSDFVRKNSMTAGVPSRDTEMWTKNLVANNEVFLNALGALSIVALSAQQIIATPASAIDTGFPSVVSPSGSGRAFSFFRAWGNFNTSQGANLAFGYATATLANGHIGISYNVRNVSNVTSAATNLVVVCMAGYV